MANDPQPPPGQVKAGAKEPPRRPFPPGLKKKIAASRIDIAHLKEQIKLLLRRAERQQIAAAKARLELERFEHELAEADRRLQKWRIQQRGRN